MNESEFLPVYPGWNVWNVWQVKDLPFSLMMVGVSPERQLRIWVEDKLRLSGVDVADSIDLKGGQIELLKAEPKELLPDRIKEQVPGQVMTVSGPAAIHTLRFFNRGVQTQMAWPHDESYLLDRSFIPSSTSPATSGTAPPTIAQTIGDGLMSPIGDVVKSTSPVLVIGGLLAFGYYLLKNEVIGNVRNRLRSVRGSGGRRGKGS